MKPVALITGASRGIGRGIAEALAGAGYSLCLNYRSDRASAEAAAAQCHALGAAAGYALTTRLIQADISSAADRARLVAECRSGFGRLDLLVNNAGVAPEVRADLLDVTEASLDRMLAVNLKGPFLLTQLVARWMIELGAQQPPLEDYTPRIVTISSISTYTASVNRGDYCVAKAGLGMLTKVFAARLADYGIGVYEVRPGIIATDMTAPVRAKYDALIGNGLTPIRRWGTPADVGRAVAAIAQGALPFSTGEVLNVDGGFHLHRL
jgi:NAD(P)-dependent dehydrogenase (short-subunit alcohol dehydrogenase family)